MLMLCSESFDIVTLKSMAIDSERFLSAKNWILSMTDCEDDENGEEFWLWMEKNNELAKIDSRNLFNTFFMFFRADPNVVVATGSIVADDQEMGKRFNLEDSIWIAGVNVHRELRGKSFGKFFFNYIDNFIQQVIVKDTKVFLATNNIRAKKIYQQYYFQSKGFIQGNSIEQYNEIVTNLFFLSRIKYFFSRTAQQVNSLLNSIHVKRILLNNNPQIF